MGDILGEMKRSLNSGKKHLFYDYLVSMRKPRAHLILTS